MTELPMRHVVEITVFMDRQHNITETTENRYESSGLTFRGPCIVIYSYNKSQRDELFLKFILVKNSTCFGQIYCPSSGVSTLCTRNRYLSCQLCWLYASEVRILTSLAQKFPASYGTCKFTLAPPPIKDGRVCFILNLQHYARIRYIKITHTSLTQNQLSLLSESFMRNV